ncbi:MAG: hypothetical protein Edafosvirus26_4 [Edafosvirus sp.]|uniref:Uncharacterized protein n=1 Tax=Edafosvirus sp. TaxID=2487765 RepID=A0A3G4ZUW4_9VIRU|nr:MAG: hypothetical protein Edafosvirus26_4 [Edafosvirus sp.]
MATTVFSPDVKTSVYTYLLVRVVTSGFWG